MGQELAVSLKQIDALISLPENDGIRSDDKRRKASKLGEMVKTALRDVWKRQDIDIFGSR